MSGLTRFHLRNAWVHSGLLVLLACLLVTPGLVLAQKLAPAVRIPDPKTHASFLYGEWQPDRPNVVLFIDPLCPYCKKIIPKLERITAYNLFVFWSPIFGGRSETEIRRFFHCPKPTGKNELALAFSNTSPAGPACSGSYKAELRRINDDLLATYPVDGVPAFFLQGKSVGFASIAEVERPNPLMIQGVRLNWQRYEAARLDATQAAQHQALLLPKALMKNARSLINQYKPAYVFLAGDNRAGCKLGIPLRTCQTDSAFPDRPQTFLDELTALLDLNSDDKAAYLISFDGAVLRQN